MWKNINLQIFNLYESIFKRQLEVYNCETSQQCKFWNFLVRKISVFEINGNTEEFMQLFYQTKSQLGFRRRYIHHDIY